MTGALHPSTEWVFNTALKDGDTLLAEVAVVKGDSFPVRLRLTSPLLTVTDAQKLIGLLGEAIKAAQPAQPEMTIEEILQREA